MENKLQAVLLMTLTAALTLGGMTSLGLLQSTEQVTSSGIITVPPPTPPTGGGGGGTPPPPPPEPTVEIDVYSDQACTQTLTSINWGSIEAGDSSNIDVYVKNAGDSNIILSLDTGNWTPSNVSSYSSVTWDYDGSQISPDQVEHIVITLSVDSGSPAFSGFNFDLIIIGS